MWTIKRFKTRERMKAWINKHGDKYQWNEVFINNAYGVECRKLRIIGG